MSYLLMQIFICLLIAGLIGLLIGWLLRGGCKNELRDNDNNWNNKLDESNAAWKNKVHSLTDTNRRNTDSSTFQISNLKGELETAQIGFDQNIIELSAENKALESTWSAKFNNSNSSWEQKVQGFMSTGNSKDKELSALKNNITALELENKEMNSKLNNYKVSRLSMEEKLKASENEWNLKYNRANSNWEKKAQVLTDENDEKVQNLNTELNNLRGELLSSEEKLKVSNHTKSSSKEVSSTINTVKPELLTQARNGKKDNLTLVRGIGKVLEERLNNLGVYHFDQIASWSKEQQSWMDERMSFPGRVEREEWVKQATALAMGTETEFSKRVKQGDVPSSKEE